MKPRRGGVLRHVPIVIAALVFGFAIAEVAVRAWCSRDADGNYFIGETSLPPLQLPVASTRNKIRIYLRAGDRAFLIYDPVLGWAPRANGRSKGGLYQYNSQTIRSPREIEPAPAAGTVRIGLFGDSFVHGDEVHFDETMGFLLEQQLRNAGFDVEVVNFGVAGYGTDQAFLRWRALGKAFSPHIVIQGLYMENVARNVNLVRPIYHPKTGIPFAKPRFILHGEQLALVNVPPIPPQQLADAIADFESSPLRAHEHFLAPYLAGEAPWFRSKAIALLFRVRPPGTVRRGLYDLADEPARLTLRILEQFRREVEAEGAQFVAVHLPDAADLRRTIHRQKPAYSELLANIAKRFDVALPESRLAEYAREKGPKELFSGGHYSAKGNALVAEVLASHLRPRLQTHAIRRIPSPRRL